MLELKTKHWIQDSKGRMVMGEGRMKMLKSVKETGSLTTTAKELGMSYRALWGKLKATESALGVPLLDSTKAKGSLLTPIAEELLSRYEEFLMRCRVLEERLFKEIFGNLLSQGR